ncbi:MAG: VOC family protein [Dokdonella sp.]
MLNTAYERHERPAAAAPTRIAAHADVALYFDCPDLDAAWAHLRDQGVEVAAPVVRDYGMRQLILIDPDGFKLCFQCPAA